MKTDAQLKKDMQAELEWDASINATLRQRRPGHGGRGLVDRKRLAAELGLRSAQCIALAQTVGLPAGA